MKRVVQLAVVCLVSSLIYYLGFHPYEYSIRFRTSTTPGDIIESLRLWDRSMDNSTILEVDSFDHMKMQIQYKGSNYDYRWHFKHKSDSSTEVQILVSEPDRKLQNKVLVPFAETVMETHALELGNSFYELIKTHLKKTKIKLLGESTLDSVFCMCKRLETGQVAKANAMMKDYPLFISFVDTYHLKLKGSPLIKVIEWSHQKGKIKFDFCFPLDRSVPPPPSDMFEFKTFPPQRALKAEYHGNYITSDRAWYALTDFANRNGYKIVSPPIELFYDNPNLGLNEEKWKAEVYLPIIKQ
ncbi:MAG: GyrI-like domain-containing protein [Cyclobacteriaceae bacterium]|nr:GyrI-like domain-containing protein [Cyclobacteriaceae bacterium]